METEIKKIRDIDTRKFINWLRNKPNDFIELFINALNLPNQMKDVLNHRCLKYNSFDETCLKTHLSSKQQKIRIRKIKQKLDYIIEDIDLFDKFINKLKTDPKCP